MTDQERMRERISIYADADARNRLDAESCAKYSPTLEEIFNVMGEETRSQERV